ncbi:LysE family protein [Burkholderia pseudomallei 668]|nr:LysE family protein [Burkholderia pseudomallei 668]
MHARMDAWKRRLGPLRKSGLGHRFRESCPLWARRKGVFGPLDRSRTWTSFLRTPHASCLRKDVLGHENSQKSRLWECRGLAWASRRNLPTSSVVDVRLSTRRRRTGCAINVRIVCIEQSAMDPDLACNSTLPHGFDQFLASLRDSKSGRCHVGGCGRVR